MFGTRLRLRLTLVTTIVGLVLATALIIGGSAAVLTLIETRGFIDRARNDAVRAASGELRGLFNIPARISSEFAVKAHRGVLPLDRREVLVAQFAERLRVYPELARVGYGNAVTGVYIGAARWRFGSDEIVEFIADPKIADGIPSQYAVTNDGHRSEPSYVEEQPFILHQRPWFPIGMSAPGPVWSGFYRLPNGGIGITGMTRFAAPGTAGPPVGVFHVDLRLESIAKFLSALHVGERGAVFLVDAEGRRLVSPEGGHVAAAASAVDAARGRPRNGSPVGIEVNGGSYEIAFAEEKVGGTDLAIAVVVDLAETTENVRQHAWIAGGIALFAAMLAIWFGIELASRIARPVAAIAGDLAAVGDFKISSRSSEQSFIREISELGHSVDKMKASLRSFGRYVPTDLVRTLLAAGREAELGGETRKLTIQFADVAGFTSISERLEPMKLVEATGRYFEAMTKSIANHEGTVDKFMGDGILAFFNAPLDVADHPRKACLAALEAQRHLAVQARDAAAKGEPVFHVRIGLSVGHVIVGNMGTHERFAYTVIGDEVNLASRIEGLNKTYGTSIIASDHLVAETGDAFEWRKLDRVAVKGRQQETLVCELLGLRGEVPAAVLQARDLYERALRLYFAGEFRQAGALFQDAAGARPDDKAALEMFGRCRKLEAAPPATWNGAHVMREA
ncbi:MAG: adenylate/guanylate cyclase domain-containing protein [Pseudomonadota bacterium]